MKVQTEEDKEMYQNGSVEIVVFQYPSWFDLHWKMNRKSTWQE